MKKYIIKVEGIKDAKLYEGSYLPGNKAILNGAKLFGVVCNKAGTEYSTELTPPKAYVARPEFADVYVSTLEGATPVPVAEYVDKLYGCYDNPKACQHFGLDRTTLHRKVYGVLNDIVHQLGEFNKDKVYGSCAYQEVQAETAMAKAFTAQDQALKGQVYALAKDLSKDEAFCERYGIRVGVPTAVLYRFNINLIEDCVPVTTGAPCYAEALDNAQRYGIAGLEEYSLKDPNVSEVHVKQVHGKESRRFVALDTTPVEVDTNPYNIYTSVLQAAASRFNFTTEEFNSEVEDSKILKEILVKAKFYATLHKGYVKGTTVVPDITDINKAKKALFDDYNGRRSNYNELYAHYSNPKYTSKEYKDASVDGNHDFVEAMVKTTKDKALTVLACKFINLQAAYMKMYDMVLTNEFGEEVESRYDFRSAPTSREDLEDYMKEYDNPSYTSDQLQYWRAHWDK